MKLQFQTILKFSIYSFFVFVFILFFQVQLTIKAHAASNMDVVLQTPGTKYIGHQFNVDVRVNTDGNQVDTISVRNLNFDPTKLQYVSTSIQTVFASQTTLVNTGGSNYRRVDIGKLPLTANYSNTTHVTVVRFTFLPINTGGGPTGTTTLTLDFDATPSTTGTFLGGIKNLASVTPLTINIAEDNTPPVISNCSPIASATNVPVITSVQCDVQDFETGIYLGGTSMIVNGITYLNSGPNQFTFTSISNGYKLTVTPAVQFPYFANIPVSVTTQDNAYDNGPVLARNSSTLPTYTFQTEDDNDPPEVYGRNPNIGAINVATNANVNFNIRDIAVPGGYPGTGVDLSTLQVTISAPGWGPVTYTQGGPNTFTSTPINAPWNYAISINPAFDFPQNVTVTVNIVAQDFDSVPPNPNVLNASYTFSTLDSTPPVCNFVSPVSGSTNNSVNTSVVVNCTDSGVGVDINSVKMVVNQVIYTASGPNTFTYTGTPNNYQITVIPVINFPNDYAFEVVVTGKDLSNNQMSMLSYGLATGTSAMNCPTCPVCPNSNNNNSIQSNSLSQQCPNNLVTNSTLVETVIKEEIVEVPFRTTKEELENIQLMSINGIELNMQIQKILIDKDIIKFTGVAQQYANISILIESTPLLLTTIADSEGQWSVETRNVLPPGDHKVFGISRNEKTGEITQKSLYAYLEVIDNNISNSGNNFLLFCILFAFGVMSGAILTSFYNYSRENNFDRKQKKS